MAYEASEIMMAAALMYSTDELMDYAKDAAGLKQLMIDAKKKIKATTNKNIQFGSPAIEKGFTDLINPNNTEAVKDMAGGISAAIGVRNYLLSNGESGGKKLSPTIYMTGNVWPKEVEKFRVSAYGFEDYNSADVIATADKNTFYGISLKKKRKSAAGEPTLINKAFDSVLDGKQFDSIKEQLAKVRAEYFSGLVIEAVDKRIILKSHIKNFDQLKRTPQGKKELFEAKQRDKKLFDRSYIDTKGYAGHKDGYLADDTKNPKSMRYFVNKKLAESNNPLWKEFIKVLNAHADLFAESLINIILKVNLYKEIDSKDLGKYEFNFFLVTGVGDVSSKGDVTIDKATVLPLKTTLCGLTRIQEMYKNKKYEIILNKEKKGESDAAKIFLQLKRGTLTLLDLEIRYKGAFTPQPQFQGTLHPDFKKLLADECGLE
jgi:hypothetical protein